MLFISLCLQCHKELGNVSEARNWVQLARSTPAGANEVKPALQFNEYC